MHPRFTTKRANTFQLKPGKKQSLFWDGYAPGLGDDDFLWWTETGLGECRETRSEKRYSCRNAAEIYVPWGNLDHFRVELYGEATVVKP
jgi:hypothetical protein